VSDDTTTEAPPPPPPPPGTPAGPRRAPWHARRLRRSTRDRYIGGVAGGIAQTYGIDPVLVRVAFVVASVFGGGGVIVYVVLWAVIPPDDGTAPLVRHRPIDAGRVLGFVLLAAGAIALMDRVFPHDGWDGFDLFWPLALVAGGVAILLLRANPAPPELAPPGANGFDDAGAGDVPPAVGDTTEWSVEEPPPPPSPSTEPPAAVPPTDSAWAPPAPWPFGPPTPPVPPLPPVAPHPPFGAGSPPPPRHHRRREPSFLAPLTVSVLLIFVGTAAFLSAIDALEVDPAVVAAIALITVGAALFVGAWFGRARSLLALGVVGTIVAGALATIDVPLRGGVGERRYAPSLVATVRDEYRLAIGELEVDLTEVEWTRGTHQVDVSLGIGEAIVRVPRGVTVDVSARSGMGEVSLFGREQHGVDADDEVLVRAAREGAAVLRIDAEVGIGAVRVERGPETLR
jgi:phage shock protein PspC (stress-responsive transcriptional regulator)/predicted membrane protein